MNVGRKIRTIVAWMVATGLAAVGAPAAAATPADSLPAERTAAPGWQPPSVLRGCTDPGAVAESWAGVTHGFMSCRRGVHLIVLHFRISTTGAVTITETPWTGQPLAVSYDRGHYSYLVGNLGGVGLAVGRFDENTGTASPLTLLTNGGSGSADIVARNGKWWAVWTQIAGADFELYQRRTMFSTQPTTQITSNAEDDTAPSIDVDGAAATMIWTRYGPANSYSDLRIADSGNGSGWVSSRFATGGSYNNFADLRTFGGHKFVAWNRDSSSLYAEKLGSGFVAKSFSPGGANLPKVLGGGRKALIWETVNNTNYGEYGTGGWNTGIVPIAGGHPNAIVQVGSRPAVIYSVPGSIKIIKRSS